MRLAIFTFPAMALAGVAQIPQLPMQDCAGALGTSPDGSCGGQNGYTCSSGNCCSQWGFCGSQQAFCGSGCQPKYGQCTSGPIPSPDGSCGAPKGYVCSQGNCCSQFGFCGSAPAFCGTGCQKTFGKCD